jgi:hypothetical protein
MLYFISAFATISFGMALHFVLKQRPNAISIQTKYWNAASSFFKVSDPGPNHGRVLMTNAAMIIKEGSIIAGIYWLEERNPKANFESWYALPTLIILCSCHLMDAENNLRAIIIEAVFMLAAFLTSMLQA